MARKLVHEIAVGLAKLAFVKSTHLHADDEKMKRRFLKEVNLKKKQNKTSLFTKK